MITRFYKTSQFIQLLFLFLFGLLIWVPRFFINPEIPYPTTGFYGLFVILNNSPCLSKALSLLFLILSAFFTQRSLNYDRLYVSGHFFPMFLFFMLASMPNVIYFSPVSISLFIFAFSLKPLLIIPETKKNDHLIFGTSLLLSFASIIYAPMIFLILIFLFPIFTKGLFSRKTVVALLGFLFPYIWLIAILYLFPGSGLQLELKDMFFTSLSQQNITENTFDFTIVLICGICFILFILRLLTKIPERTVIIRRRNTIAILIILIIFFSAYFSYNFFEHLSLLAVPMTILISYYYNEDSKAIWLDYALMITFFFLLLYPYIKL